MPELPEVETTKLSLSVLLGLSITNVSLSGYRLREPIPSDLDKLVDRQLVAIHRRAKYLLLDFRHHLRDDTAINDIQNNTASQFTTCEQQKDTLTLLIHLGMSGSLQQYNTPTARKHDHVIFEFDNPKNACSIYLHYHDPRRFGMVMWATDGRRFLDKLGAEPLESTFNAHYLYNIIHRTLSNLRPIIRPIKAVIMDQQIVVGVGNIYAAESLFLSAIHPATPAHHLSIKQLDTLVSHIKTVLARSIAVGGSTLKDFTVADGQTGYFQQTLFVYGKQGEPCPHCHLPLENIKIAGRASVFCPSCQSLTDV